MLQSVWGLPVVCYLFFGGLAGGLGSCAGVAVIYGGAAAGKTVKWCSWLSLLCLVTGVVFLFLDLGNSSKALGTAIFLHPGSWISRGTWVIVAFALVLAVFLLIVSRTSSRVLSHLFASYQYVRDRIALALSWFLLVCGCALGLYTGFLLGGSLGIPFWQSPFLPLLFLMSSLGSGMSVFSVAHACLEPDASQEIRILVSRLTSVSILAECVFLVLLLVFSWLSSDPAVHGSAELVLVGFNAPVFWVSVVGLGYIASPCLRAASARSTYRAVRSLLESVSSLCILVAMFSLRWCIVFSGMLIS